MNPLGERRKPEAWTDCDHLIRQASEHFARFDPQPTPRRKAMIARAQLAFKRSADERLLQCPAINKAGGQSTKQPGPTRTGLHFHNNRRGSFRAFTHAIVARCGR